MSPRERPWKAAKASDADLEKINRALSPTPAATAKADVTSPADEPPAQPVATAPTTEGDHLEKLTVAFRAQQLEQLRRRLARWTADGIASASIAEVVRLAVDRVLQDLEQDPDAVLRDLRDQVDAENAAGIERKYSRSRFRSE